MSKRAALGKGIDALIRGGGEEKPERGEGRMMIPLDRIAPNPDQPRKHFDETKLAELADSIRQKGIIQPILAEETEDGRYLIVAGERRYRAARLAGLAEVPVLLLQVTEQERIELALIENVQRDDLNPIEEAAAYRTLMEHSDLGQEDVAKRVGKNRSTVANALRLLKLPREMQDAISVGDLSAGHARAILSVVNPADQKILFGRIVHEGLSVREAERLAGELNHGIRGSEKKKPLPKRKAPEIQEIEQRLIDRLGTKVALQGSARKGKIEIAYFSMDDLDRLCSLLLDDD